MTQNKNASFPVAATFLGLAALLGSGMPMAFAQDAANGDADAAMAAEAKAPDVIVRNAVQRVRGLIQENADRYREDKDAFYAMIDREIIPHFDMPYIARLVLGRHARQAEPEQRRRFATAFKETLTRTYADAMLQYNSSVEAEFLPLRMADDAERATVETRLKVEDGEPIPISFVMHTVDGEWLIYDISVEGISLVTNFRAQFNQRIREEGLDALITKLESGAIEASPTGETDSQ
ncbi:ABC transporter substrate-binding protein [Algiphilus sp.]|uniref:MlaC/ttg2D family ABC transporter substrate-binding protein n=1 Tax=Algiphilus sp. TaxID=1872431 RepID=UPI002A644713|nr:ABC transporter substrate-binding protein [Pseudomonadota bacterium]